MNANCAWANARFRAIEREPTSAASYSRVVALYRTGIGRFDVLKPPAADSATFHRYLRALRRQEGVFRRVRASIEAGEGEGDFSSLLDTYRQERLTAGIDLGAERCGER
jgi:hypothetical protein